MIYLLLGTSACLLRRISPWILVFIVVFNSTAYADEPLECLIEPHLLIDVSSSEIGVLASVNVDAADRVRKNDVIAALRTDVENAAYDVTSARARSESEIELLKREHEYAVRRRQRVDELNAENIISKQDVDEVHTTQSAAKLRFQAASEKQHTARLEAIRDELALARRIVRSPIDGVVISKYRNVGEYVDGDPILQIAQLDPLRIRVIVPMDMFGQIKIGMQAVVTPELSIEGPFVATVTSIDPMVDAATATLGVRLSLPNPDNRLPAGLKCTLNLLAENESIASVDSATDNDETTKLTLSPAAPAAYESPILAAAITEERPDTIPNVIPAIKPFTEAPLPTSVVKPDDHAVSSSTTVSDGENCLSLSSLKDLNEVETITSVLTSVDMRFTGQYESEKSNGTSWRVLSSKPYDQPDDLLKRLNKSGITDVRWIKHGTWKGRMSYGVYSNQTNAKKHVTNLQKLGLEVDLIPRFDTSAELRIDVQTQSSNQHHKNIIESIQEYYPELTTKPIPCSLFASR